MSYLAESYENYEVPPNNCMNSTCDERSEEQAGYAHRCAARRLIVHVD